MLHLLQIFGNMTLDKKEVITLPKWLVIIVAPMIVAGIVTYGSVNFWKGSAETKINRAEAEIQKLDEKKLDRDEFEQLMKTINRVEDKLDKHIEQSLIQKK